MSAQIIDGKALAAATKAEAAAEAAALKAQGIEPCLAVILVGENPASQVYVRGKINDCAQCGIESRSINLPADTTQETLLAEVKKLADDPAVHGILVQLPLPEQIDEKAVIDADLVVTQDLCAVCAVDVSVVDDALAPLGLRRTVAVTTPHFAAVPFILKGARLLSTVPQPAARIFAGRFGLAASPVPVALPGIDVSMLWHASYDHDPAHRWLRGTVARLAAEL